jgi:hypothetical protein
MTRSKRTWRSAENGQNGADSGSICAQLYRMYRKLPKKKQQHRQRKRLRMREKEWSGRMDLNHRPPGPEPGALARLSHAPTAMEPSLVISGRSLVPIDLADKSARSAELSHAPTGPLRHF